MADDPWADFVVANKKDEWRDFVPSPVTDTVWDALKSAGTGLVKGGAAVATLPMALKDALGTVADLPIKGINYAQTGSFSLPAKPETGLDSVPSAPRADDVVRAIEQNVTGKLHKPETRVGRYAETVGEFVPAAVAGPGGMVRNAIRYAVAPGVAAEAAGEASKGTAYEPYARAAGSVAGLALGHVAMRPNTPGRVAAEAMGTAVDDVAVANASRLMQDAQARGITLTWPEAIQQVTGGATKLADVQRVVEGSQSGGAAMRPVMAERPAQVDRAVQQNLDRVAAPGMDPFTVGPRASQAATQTVDEVRNAINNHTRPLYDAARHDLIPEPQFQSLAADPRFIEGLRAVRNHREIGPELAQFPDNAIPVVDQVKKLLQTRAEVTPAADATERYLSGLRGTAGTNAANAATVASPSYAQAVAEQARLRGQYLNPLEQGPVGRAAGQTGNEPTESVVRSLLPDAPLPGSEAQVGQAFRAIGMRDADAAANVVRQKMAGTYDQSARALQSGLNEWGGANYAAKLYGNPTARDNLRSAISETAGPAVRNDLDELIQALQATGRRQHPGSQTEPNRLMTKALEGGGVIGEAASAAAGKFNPFSAIRDRYQQYRYGANTGDLARLLLEATPAEISRLAQTGGGSPQARLLIAQVLAEMAAKDKAAQQSK